MGILIHKEHPPMVLRTFGECCYEFHVKTLDIRFVSVNSESSIIIMVLTSYTLWKWSLWVNKCLNQNIAPHFSCLGKIPHKSVLCYCFQETITKNKNLQSFYLYLLRQ